MVVMTRIMKRTIHANGTSRGQTLTIPC